MTLKVFLSILILAVTTIASPTLNLNKLQGIQRFIDNLEASPSVLYRSYLPSTYSTALNGYNGFLQFPVIPALPALRYNGVNQVYVPPQGYYGPHTGQLTGQVLGSYPLTYNGYAHSYGWKH